MTPLAAIHVARKRLGMDEDTYRGFLVRETGKTSARDMSEAERLKVVRAFEREGFAPRPAPSSGPAGHLLPGGAKEGRAGEGKRRPDGRAKLTGKYAGKLQALWIAAWNLGLARNRDDAALTAFIKRQTGLDAVRFLQDGGDAAKAIEALKGWMAREAGVDWSVDVESRGRSPGERIARAQFAAIRKDGGLAEFASFRHWLAHAFTRIDPDAIGDREWIAIMNALGEFVRAKGPAATPTRPAGHPPHKGEGKTAPASARAGKGGAT